MAAAMGATSLLGKTAFAGRQVAQPKARTATPARNAVVVTAADRKLWAPGVVAPEYLDGKMAGDYGWDPLGLGADPTALSWYRQSELQHARWAMLGVAGILVQELAKPGIFWYNAGLPENLPAINFGGPTGEVNLGGILAWEFLLMHWVEVRRWQDYKKFGSVNQDPVFSSNVLSNPEMGYPGFDPLGFAKDGGESFRNLQTKEIKNGRLAMVAFAGFTLAAQTTGKNPLAALGDHLANPFNNNIATNIGTCAIPHSVNVQGLTIPLTCLWPGNQIP